MSVFWYLLVGFLLIAIAVLGRIIDRLPMSPAMIYLLVGFALGPVGFDALELHPMRHLTVLEAITEAAVLISLFTVGVKLRVPVGDARWRLPLRLATLSMVLTILGIAVAAHYLLEFPWGLALLLGAILAPTDPVLASEVQLRSPEDRNVLRFGVTGEGGLNDGTAFPFVFLALGLLGLHDLGEYGLRWLSVDLIWGTVAGLGVGFAIGAAVARGVRALRERREDAAPLNEFLLLGVIALSYGAALAVSALGFLAVFAAGLALRRADDMSPDRASHDTTPLTPNMLKVNEHLERIVEVAIVLLVGAMISTGYWSLAGLLLAAIVFLVVRPLSVWIGLLGARRAPRRLIAWFGIRGIGSVYYALFAVRHGLEYSVAAELMSCVFTVIAASIVVHGVSAAPLMSLYQRCAPRSRPRQPAVSDKS